jgi:hypothetical protein
MSASGLAIDEICPEYVEEERIALTLDANAVLKAFTPISVHVDDSACAEVGGLIPPLEVAIRTPSPGGWERRILRSVPSSWIVSFTPVEGGTHFVLVRELFHNRLWGKLRIHVVGERLRMLSAL